MSLLSLATSVQAQADPLQADPLKEEKYLTPPPEIASYFELPRHKQYTLANLNSAKTWFARLQTNGPVRLADISTPYENMGGLMFDPKANRARNLSYRTGAAIVFTNAATFEERTIPAPQGCWVGGLSWSPNGKHALFMVHNEMGSHLYVHDLDSNKTRQLTSRAINAIRVTPQWSGDSQSIALVLVPRERGPEPKAGATPNQPKVQVTDKNKNNLRTYRSLLQNELDQARLEYFLTGQLAKVSVKDGATKEIGKPMMIASVDPSPTGSFFRVSTVQKPFSYIVPTSSFGNKEEVWDEAGKSLITLNTNPLRVGGEAPEVPDANGRRQIDWSPDGKGLMFVRTVPPAREEKKPAEDEQGRGAGRPGAGAPEAGVKRKESLFLWTAPFGKDNEKAIYTTENGLAGLVFSPDGSTIYLNESAEGNTTFYRIDLSDTTKKTKLWSWKTSDASKNPGAPVTSVNAFGATTLKEVSGKILLRGVQTDEANPDKNPPRPFLDEFDIATGKIERKWQCPEGAYETIDGILNDQGTKLVISHQSATEVSNSYLVEGTTKKQLTKNVDLAPDLTMAKRERIQVTRADGFKFWVKVTLPAYHVAGDKLPAFFWFYPSEFESQEAYDKQARAGNPNLFPAQGGSPKTLLLRRGWAFVEPDCPIVGPKGRINDFYVNDLRNSLSAIIDELDKRGLCDRTKLAIGGHSYGGFSTANAMVHTPFFKAGIAGAGNYNRTLTPTAFQSETRTLFEAKDTYMSMSAILYAENLSGALLMYAGMDDQNVGTDPVNSIRMFHVLESIGKPAALYMYPYEDHGQIAKETLMDQWARWIPWLDKYVLGVEKAPDKPADKPAEKPAGK